IDRAHLARRCTKTLPASAGGSRATRWTRAAGRIRTAAQPGTAGGAKSAGTSRRGWRGGKTGLGLGWQLELRLADVDEPPLAILGHGIFVTLAQETQVVSVLQLLQRDRISSVPVIELLDGDGILHAAELELFLVGTLDLLGDAWKFYCHCGDHQ